MMGRLALNLLLKKQYLRQRMTLDKLNSQSLALFFSRHQKQVHLAIVVLLSLYLLAWELTGQLAAGPVN